MPHVLPEPAALFELSADRIRRAAAKQWPGELVTLGAHVPSVTSYVRRLQLAGPLPRRGVHRRQRGLAICRLVGDAAPLRGFGVG